MTAAFSRRGRIAASRTPRWDAPRRRCSPRDTRRARPRSQRVDTAAPDHRQGWCGSNSDDSPDEHSPSQSAPRSGLAWVLIPSTVTELNASRNTHETLRRYGSPSVSGPGRRGGVRRGFRKHCVVVGVGSPRPVHDPRPGVLLRRHGAGEERPQHVDDELLVPVGRAAVVGGGRLHAGLQRGKRVHRGLRQRLPRQHPPHDARGLGAPCSP